MDFGELLDEWERRSAKPGGLDAADEAGRRARAEEAQRRDEALREAEMKRRETSRLSLESWLSTHGVTDKDAAEEGSREGEPGGRRGGDRGRGGPSKGTFPDHRPIARLDLHGKNQAEAESALGLFLEDAARSGIARVLVITGKGNHSADGPVLAKAVRRFLESNPRAGRFSQAGRREGGAGALWVEVRLGRGTGGS